MFNKILNIEVGALICFVLVISFLHMDYGIGCKPLRLHDISKFYNMGSIVVLKFFEIVTLVQNVSKI